MKVYVSAPVKTPSDKVQEVLNLFTKRGIEVTAWREGMTYYNYFLNNADAVVFILPEFSWRSEIYSLPNGVKNEVKRAVEQRKLIYIAYIPTQINKGVMNIYEAEITNGFIQGKPGTGNSIFSQPKTLSPEDVAVRGHFPELPHQHSDKIMATSLAILAGGQLRPLTPEEAFAYVNSPPEVPDNDDEELLLLVK